MRESERERHRQTDRQIDSETDGKQTDRLINNKKEIQIKVNLVQFDSLENL